MSIHGIGPELPGPDGVRRARDGKEDGEGPRPVSESARVRPNDRVELSGEARALAAREAELRDSGDEDRLAEVRSRLAEGFYERSDVVERIARRILASGDL